MSQVEQEMKCLSSMDYLSISISANTSRQKMVFEIVSSMVEIHSPKKCVKRSRL